MTQPISPLALCHPAVILKIQRACQFLRTGQVFCVPVRNKKGKIFLWVYENADGTNDFWGYPVGTHLNEIVRQAFHLYYKRLYDERNAK